MEERGWSARKLAAEAGIAHQTVSSLVAGKFKPTMTTLEKISAALGVSVVDLVGGGQ